MGAKLVKKPRSIHLNDMKLGDVGMIVECHKDAMIIGDILVSTGKGVVWLGERVAFPLGADDHVIVRILQPGEQIEIT